MAILFSEEELRPVVPGGLVVDTGILAGTTAGPPGDSQSMAVPVTRHAGTPPGEEFQFLLSGIDSLDLGLYVVWGTDWKRRLRTFNKKKQQARKKGGLLIGLPSGRTCTFRANGKGENYRFHLQFEAYNLFISIAARPGSSPNVYLSINAKTLWLQGIETALSWITEDLKAIGGWSIKFVQVSRVDLCCDFWVPGASLTNSCFPTR